MENFPAYYTMLFNAITDALRLIEQEQYDDAFLLLTDAQVRSAPSQTVTVSIMLEGV